MHPVPSKSMMVTSLFYPVQLLKKNNNSWYLPNAEKLSSCVFVTNSRNNYKLWWHVNPSFSHECCSARPTSRPVGRASSSRLPMYLEVCIQRLTFGTPPTHMPVCQPTTELQASVLPTAVTQIIVWPSTGHFHWMDKIPEIPFTGYAAVVKLVTNNSSN